MKISKTVLGLAITGVLLAGWQNGSKAEEVMPVAEATTPVVAVPEATVPVAAAPEATAPVAAAPEVTAPVAAEATTPATEVPAVTSAPAHATEIVPVPVDATGTAPAAPAVAPAASEITAPAATVPGAIAGTNISIADLYAKKAEFSGKNVTVLGKVVKVNKGVMGKNWLHIQDGTGAQGTNDLTITTSGSANPNDKVSVSGILILDKDFGAGYKYEVIIEDATVTAQ